MLLILLVVNGFQELANFFDAGGLDLLVLVLHSDLASVLGLESGSGSWIKFWNTNGTNWREGWL